MLAARIFRRVSSSVIDEDLRRLGVRRGDALLALVSLRSLGWVVGGPSVVADSLIQAVGQQGIVMTPCFAALDPLPALPPDGVFDQGSAPSAAGAISEALRSRDGVLRSLHPVGSMAVSGLRAAEWIEGHEDHVTPFGPGTPLDRLVRSGGKILAVGTHLGPVLLYLQELAGFPFLYEHGEREAVVRARAGASHLVRTRLFRSRSCQVVILQGERPETRDYVLMRDYALVFPPDREAALLRGGYLRHNLGRLVGRLERLKQRGVVRLGRVGNADAALIEGAPFCEQIGADLVWEVERFRDEYDPERLALFDLS